MGRQAQNIYGTELILIIYLVARNSFPLGFGDLSSAGTPTWVSAS